MTEYTVSAQSLVSTLRNGIINRTGVAVNANVEDVGNTAESGLYTALGDSLPYRTTLGSFASYLQGWAYQPFWGDPFAVQANATRSPKLFTGIINRTGVAVNANVEDIGITAESGLYTALGAFLSTLTANATRSPKLFTGIINRTGVAVNANVEDIGITAESGLYTGFDKTFVSAYTYGFTYAVNGNDTYPSPLAVTPPRVSQAAYDVLLSPHNAQGVGHVAALAVTPPSVSQAAYDVLLSPHNAQGVGHVAALAVTPPSVSQAAYDVLLSFNNAQSAGVLPKFSLQSSVKYTVLMPDTLDALAHLASVNVGVPISLTASQCQAQANLSTVSVVLPEALAISPATATAHIEAARFDILTALAFAPAEAAAHAEPLAVTTQGVLVIQPLRSAAQLPSPAIDTVTIVTADSLHANTQLNTLSLTLLGDLLCPPMLSAGYIHATPLTVITPEPPSVTSSVVTSTRRSTRRVGVFRRSY